MFREWQFAAGYVVMQFFQMAVTVPRCRLCPSSEVLSSLEKNAFQDEDAGKVTSLVAPG